MIPKIRVFAKAGTRCLYGGGCDKDKVFTEVRDLDWYEKDVTVWGCGNADCGTCDDTYRLQDVEVMQSTRTKDKKGVEIYEGDILKFTTSEVNGGEYVDRTDIKAVEYCDGAYFVGVHLLGEVSLEDDELEIIGNIYENPELLEVAK